jgi:hypothetical protein
MKVRGNNYPSCFNRGVIFSRIGLFFLLCALNFTPALAQETPVLRGVSPQESRLGEQVNLVLEGDGFSQLDNLTSINIGGMQIPFSSYEIIDNQTITVSLRIPEKTPAGRQRINFTFDNELRLEALFTILEPSEPDQGLPLLYGVSPQEGHPGQQLRITLDGEGLSGLGELQAIRISGVDTPLLDYHLNSDQALEALVRIAEDAPPGEGDIAFFFENDNLNAYFVVLEPVGSDQEAPFLNGVSPQEGRPGEQLSLTLDGGNFSRLGALQAVNISGENAPLLDYNLVSDQAIEVLIRVPENAPSGDGDITFFFENNNLNNYFAVVQPDAPPAEEPAPASIREVSPQEGRAGSELSLILNGENLSHLGDLQSVDFNGRDIPVLNYQVLSDQRVEIQLSFPADFPASVGQISFFFDNSTFEAPFTLLAATLRPRFPIDPIIAIIFIVGVIGFIGTIGFIGRRLLRKPRPQSKNLPQQPALTPPQIYFKTNLEPGSQRVETSGKSIKADIEIRLVTKIDYGSQYIEVEHDSLTAE